MGSVRDEAEQELLIDRLIIYGILELFVEMSVLVWFVNCCYFEVLNYH